MSNKPDLRIKYLMNSPRPSTEQRGELRSEIERSRAREVELAQENARLEAVSQKAWRFMDQAISASHMCAYENIELTRQNAELQKIAEGHKNMQGQLENTVCNLEKEIDALKKKVEKLKEREVERKKIAKDIWRNTPESEKLL